MKVEDRVTGESNKRRRLSEDPNSRRRRCNHRGELFHVHEGPGWRGYDDAPFGIQGRVHGVGAIDRKSFPALRVGERPVTWAAKDTDRLEVGKQRAGLQIGGTDIKDSIAQHPGARAGAIMRLGVVKGGKA